ncbi:zinc finger, C3HC4 type (RING finger) protein (macronuclear) [Tetrahymena thermophila SB210]|uniref:Zinc finger, C3HC4 type (RING finger) protein n=1 Tax=Tetrahymena thermophila (strain SB210) TaxID=312017 RepID=I7M2N7_TETTS|nr:zinc finger, C3HC4 type (RING finger) protein [Tetrahymena thermophila SB210]EAS00893.3 zinc finger, C3HC4 type (RING finger) protein [Tetrahymena thermophila SB210]|eukprot:XP_001021139.3 zinc finger, C3HC4 type (RING finger) protein [Tetrahymena thermophila SB210]
MKYKQNTKTLSLLTFILIQIIKLADAQTKGFMNQPGVMQFGYNQLAYVQVDQVQNESFLEFIINISSNVPNQQFKDYCFLLLMSPKLIQQQDFITDVIYSQNKFSPFMRFVQNYQVLNVDFEGLASGSKVLFLDYPQDQYNIQQTLYYYILGPYKFATSAPISSPLGSNNLIKSFNGSFTIKNQMSCLNNCSSNIGQGQCNNSDPFNTFCVCQAGFIARDCSVAAQQINIGDSSSMIVVPSETKVYLYFDIDQTNYSVGQILIVEASFTNDTEGYMISIQQDIENQNYLPDYFLWLAARLNTQVGKVITNKSQQFNLVVTPQTQGARIIVLFVSNDNTQLKFQVYPFSGGSGGSSLIILYIILGALGFIVLVYIIYIARRSKMIRRSNQQMAQNLANQANLQAQQQGRGRQNQQLQKLTIEQLNEFMPTQSFDKTMMKAPSSELCAVCLEEFVINKDQVRVTICQHIFHHECLEEWLKKQQNCPSCRQELTLQRLKEFKQNPIMYQNFQNIAVKSGAIHPINDVQLPAAQIRNDDQIQQNQILIQQQQQDREVHEAPPRLQQNQQIIQGDNLIDRVLQNNKMMKGKNHDRVQANLVQEEEENQNMNVNNYNILNQQQLQNMFNPLEDCTNVNNSLAVHKAAQNIEQDRQENQNNNEKDKERNIHL